MHGVTTPLLLPSRNIKDAQVATIGLMTLCPGSPLGTTTHENKNGEQGKGKENTIHCAKKAKSGKKQEGTNKRCPEGLSRDSGPTPPRDVSLCSNR